MSVAVGIATIVLVGITAWYATEMRRMVNEMRAERSDEAARARFERSRGHGIAVREALREVDPMHTSDITESIARRTYEALDRHGPLIANEAVRERIRIAALVAYTASWPDEQYADPALARLQVRLVGEQARWAVECYLREEPLPPWPADFPMRQWAQPWTIAGAKYEPDPDAAKAAREAFDALGA
jgi:hypothetical protein